MTTILERRRIEAEFARALYETLASELGEARAREVLGAAVRRLAREAGAAMAAKDRAEGETPSLPRLHQLTELWKQGGALEIEVLEVSQTRLDFDVTRCRYAETYEALGVRRIGDLLSCNRDGELICGYLPKARLARTRTIMQGASHCDFRFSLADDGEPEGGPR